MEYASQYPLNSITLAKISILDDFLDAYHQIVAIYQEEIARIRSKKGAVTVLPADRDPHIHSRVKQVIENLLNSYIFIYTDDYNRFFVNAYSYEAVKMYNKSNSDTLFISFEQFLCMLQNIAVKVIYKWQSQKKASIQEQDVQASVRYHISDAILCIQSGRKDIISRQLLSPQCIYYQKSRQLSREDAERIQVELDKLSSAQIWLQVLINKKETQQIIIVGKSSEAGGNILSIKQDLAKELLTAAFWGPKAGIVSYQGKRYTIQKMYLNTREGEQGIKQLFPATIRIKKNGGLFTSDDAVSNEIVNILMYSPFTKRFESAYATYDRTTREVSIDAKVFRKYVAKYGRPKVNIELALSNRTEQFTDWHNLATESILMEFGYTVSESVGLTVTDRHKCLADLVDLGIISVSKIVSQLEFNLRTHTGDRNYLARCKWQDDIDYILTYKVNPNRFYIAPY